MQPSGGSDEGILLALDAAGWRTMDKILDNQRLRWEGPCVNKLTTCLLTELRL